MPAASPVRAADHLDWAKDIARSVAHHYHLRGAELDDLISQAHLTLLAKLSRYSLRILRRQLRKFIRATEGVRRAPTDAEIDAHLEGAFRGWCYLSIWKACDRHGEWLRGGGTFRSRRPGRSIVVAPLGDSAEDLTGHVEAEFADPDFVSQGVILDEKPDCHCGRAFRSARKKGGLRTGENSGSEDNIIRHLEDAG